MAASDIQVQQFVDERIRPRCEQIRNLYNALLDDIATIDDVYNALATDPSWSDYRTDGPPHLLTPSDVLAVNTLLHNLVTALEGDAQFPIVRKSCVRLS